MKGTDVTKKSAPTIALPSRPSCSLVRRPMLTSHTMSCLSIRVLTSGRHRHHYF